jgi:hypothetical protein
LLIIRHCPCSVSRVWQPQRDSALSQLVSGIPESPVANRRILALFRPPGEAASPALHAVSRRVGCRSGGRVPVQAHGDLRRQRYHIEFQSASTKALELSSFVAIRVTHLAKKPSRCVTQFRAAAAIPRNKMGYKVMNDNSTHPDKMRHPGGVLDRSGEAGPGSLTRSRGSVTICKPAASETNPPPYQGLRNRFGGRPTHMNANTNSWFSDPRLSASISGPDWRLRGCATTHGRIVLACVIAARVAALYPQEWAQSLHFDE